VGQKLLVQDTQGEVKDIMRRKSVNLLNLDYFDMVPADDHEVIRAAIMRLRQGEQTVSVRHHIFAKELDGHHCVELVEVGMGFETDESELLFAIRNVTNSVMDPTLVAKNPSDGVVGEETELVNTSPFLGLGASCLNDGIRDDDADGGDADGLFDDFFDADEAQQEVVSFEAIPSSKKNDDKMDVDDDSVVFGDIVEDEGDIKSEENPDSKDDTWDDDDDDIEEIVANDDDKADDGAPSTAPFSSRVDENAEEPEKDEKDEKDDVVHESESIQPNEDTNEEPAEKRQKVDNNGSD